MERMGAGFWSWTCEKSKSVYLLRGSLPLEKDDFAFLVPLFGIWFDFFRYFGKTFSQLDQAEDGIKLEDGVATICISSALSFLDTSSKSPEGPVAVSDGFTAVGQADNNFEQPAWETFPHYNFKIDLISDFYSAFCVLAFRSIHTRARTHFSFLGRFGWFESSRPMPPKRASPVAIPYMVRCRL